MFQLIWLLFCLPFYILYLAIKMFIYIVIFIISLISFIFDIVSKKKKNKKIVKNNLKIDNIQKINYNSKLENIQEKTIKREFQLIQLTDIELKLTTQKIQELYKELGFYVKVIDIKRKKYITEYEVIFSREVTQSDILLVSDKIIEKFQIDGVKIVRNLQKENRICIQIPLKYEETLT